MLSQLVQIAEAAAALVLHEYQTAEIQVEYKGLNDPVTHVDRAANALILEALERAFPGIPVVAEESDPAAYEDFAKVGRAFFVDPIDGTREFIERTGEFAVMVGYAEEGRPVLGVVVRPVHACTYWGGPEGAFAREFEASVLTTRALRITYETNVQNARVCVSRSRTVGRMRKTLERLGARELVQIGSAGLKVIEVAKGAADLYAHPGEAGKAWDYCAPEAIVRAAGGVLLAGDGADIVYGDSDPLKGRGVVCGNETLVRQAIRILKEPHE
jgi:3'(2'), 5'-bisphosphate nucleotidase